MNSSFLCKGILEDLVAVFRKSEKQEKEFVAPSLSAKLILLMTFMLKEELQI